MNGTLVYDTEGNLIKIETFSTDLLDKFIKFITEKGMESEAAFYEVTKSFSLHPLSEKVIAYLNTNKVPVPEVVSIDTLMTKNIVLIAFPPIDIDIEGVKNGVDYNYKQSDEYVVCITPGSSTKKRGLEFLLRSLNTDGSNCAYIGDGDNDIEAMDYCSTSFAVGNSSDTVKSHASWVVDLNYDQGAFHKVANCMYR